MKKIFSIILTLISLNSFSQYIINQTLGSDSTLVTSKGAFKSRLINTPFTDTTQANAQRIKYYDGAQIYTKSGGGKFWIRDSANNIWLQLAVSAGVGTVTQVNTGYGLTGGPITTIGTIVWDSATASLKYVRLVDTAAMLSPYLRSINDTAYRSSTSINDTTYKLNKTVSKGTVFVFEDGSNAYIGSIANADSLAGLPASSYQLKNVSLNAQSASYTLVLADNSKLVSINNASANTLTVPPNSSVAFPIGTTIRLYQYGAGQTTVTPGAGVVIRSAGARYKLFEQYSRAILEKIGTDEWLLSGDVDL